MDNDFYNSTNAKPKPKRIYHVTDWKKYNRGLCERYSIDVWFTPKIIGN